MEIKFMLLTPHAMKISLDWSPFSRRSMIYLQQELRWLCDAIFVYNGETKIDIEYSSRIFTAWWRHMASWVIVNIGSGNGFVSSGNKPLPEPKALEILKKGITTMHLKITHSKSTPIPATHRGDNASK